jgi:hypothetical protein
VELGFGLLIKKGGSTMEHNINSIETTNNQERSSIESETERLNLPVPVYYIESAEDDTVMVAIDVQLQLWKDKDNNPQIRISWNDTTRERGMGVENVNDSDTNHFSFTRKANEGGAKYLLTPMTLDKYNSSVKQHLLDGPDFKNDTEVIEAFKNIKYY